MNKKEYIRDSIKNLDEHILVSKKRLPDGTYVTFLDYCEQYVPLLLNSKLEFENDEFIRNMEDLINYQIYMYEKYENKKEEKVEEEEIIIEEPTKEEIVEEVIIEEKEELPLIEDETTSDDLLNELNDDSPYIESIDDIEIKGYNENKLNLATKLKKYYENYLDYVVFFMKKNITLEEYIKLTYQKMDDDYNYNHGDISIPYEEEIREKASLALSSYKYVVNLVKDLHKNGIRIVDKAYTIGYITSVPANVDSSDIYYTLAIENVKESLKLLNNKKDKEEFFKNITKKRIENKKLYHDIVDFYQYSINPDMENLMNELEENDNSLDYIENVKTNIEELHRKYDAIIDKDVDELSSISKELQENLDYVISRYNETKNEELKEFFDLESEFKYKVKSDYTFHKKINKSKNAFKIINEYLNDNKKVNIALMYEQLKKINDFVDDIWIKNHQSEIITNADQIFRENLKGKLENVKELYDEAISVEYN